ncbi:sugar ABC transporter substrate-binding protein [Actinoplanes philippinensis]|uniref:Raffinose/stachyose/melibiose transport system substrate-binding protein n=1 Tax=Actinoplanes philippinensis TaxID=35752 RepID=A0A1I2H5N7_9ACTN|nr:extracellular solute-binding protein [Actinoplanes philippinensis]GIE78363.1 sugar ABC transporter substrate-binding protein [Actinoplanes philippinensis]SFF24297.1 raffinose/stachyose/melibiose transport system substrate-binding protein [Actinoplanes philippinensis]
MLRSRSGLAAGALLLAATLGLTACGSDDSSTEGADAKSLTLWHYEGPNSAMGIAWNKAIELFKASHPGVEVKFEEKGFEQIQQNAQMILNSDSAPDILEYNKGNATAGLLSKQGLLTDLSDEFTKRGWDKKLSSSLQTTAKYDEDGIMGNGKVFGVPNYGEFVTVYYNKKMFDQYKLAVPTSFDEFTKVMDTFVQNKVTPLAVGGAEYPAQQIFYELALSKSDRAFVNDYQLYTNKVDFKGPQFTYGAQTFADWVSKGYIGKDSAGIKAEDMGVSFTQGKFPILISGSWWYGRFASEIKDFEWGTFLFPGNTLHPGSSGNLWVVPEKSKAKSLAYDFIDITMSPEVQALLGNSGGVPVAADASAITDPKNKELVETFNKISTSDGLAFYPDWPAPGYYDVLVAGTQGLINGSKTPDAFLDEIAKPYDQNRSDLGK